MKSALIPPRGLENYILYSNFHLALAIPECMKNNEYVEAYQQAAMRGDYIVVDNGAADGGLVSNEELLKAASVLMAQEVVAPDVFYDKVSTVVKVKEFLKYMASAPNSQTFKVMAVVQGTNYNDLYDCVDVYSNIKDVKVLGLPKHLLTTLNLKSARIDLANWIKQYYSDRFELHFLGTNPCWIKEIASAVKYAPHIRSVDSALPFNYALASQNLATTKIELTRNPEYFNLDWADSVSARRVTENINTFMEWSSATIVEAPSSC